MVVPPGEYQVTVQPDYNDRQRVERPERMGPLWRGQVVKYGSVDKVVQWQNGDQRTMVVPPGTYQVSTLSLHDALPSLVWPQKVRIEPGQVVTFRLDSGIRMIGPP